MFMGFLAESTPAQSFTTPPLRDARDLFTPQSGGTIPNTEIQLSKNGGAFVAKNNGDATLLARGRYTMTLDATDTNTVGLLSIDLSTAGLYLADSLDFYVVKKPIHTALWSNAAAAFANITQGVNIEAINNNVTAAIRLALSVGSIEFVTFSGTPTTTVIQTDLGLTQASIKNDAVLLILDGPAVGAQKAVVGYNGSGQLTIDPLPVAPASGNTGLLI